jgi:hypothetical protein
MCLNSFARVLSECSSTLGVCSSKGVLEQRSARVLGAVGALVPHLVLIVLLHPWNSTWNCPPACLPCVARRAVPWVADVKDTTL